MNEWIPGEPRRPQHVLHLILTLITCGLWVIIWFGAWVAYEYKLGEWNEDMNRRYGTRDQRYYR